MKKHIEGIKNHTDLWPWYWLSYGEKEYAFAVVEAYPCYQKDPFPPPGSKLELKEDDNGDLIWIGGDGVEMIIGSEISNIERQNGDTICSFIAAAHTHFLKDDLSTL